MAEFDLSEVEHLADILAAAPVQADKVCAAAGVAIGAKVKAAAKAAAPKGRPWLSTSGIEDQSWVEKNASHTDVFTVEDEEGDNVGFQQEYGNSFMPPQPFLTPQMAWAGPAFHQMIVAGVEPLGGS